MTTERGSLLIVDDNADHRAELRHFLTSNGLTITEAEGGAAALALVDGRAFDLILLDVSMEGMSGMDVLKALRARHSAVDLPVIMATANDLSDDVVGALEGGANDYLTKPFDLPVVLARVRTQLSLKWAVDRIVDLEQSLAQRNAALEVANADLEDANRRMKRDLRAAAHVQEALLPHNLPLFGSATFAWKFRPCAELAGDLLNVFALDDRRVCLYVLDVVGHGVKAALLAVMVSRVLARLLSPGGQARPPNPDRLPSPIEVVAQLNREFPWDDQTQQYFTLVYGILDLETGDLCYVSAGHPGPLHLARDSAPRIHDTPGDPVGLGTDDYEECHLHLRQGERLYLFSDGVVDALTPDSKRFGPERLCRVLDENRSLPLLDGLERLTSALTSWCSPDLPHDDISILGVEML